MRNSSANSKKKPSVKKKSVVFRLKKLLSGNSYDRPKKMRG